MKNCQIPYDPLGMIPRRKKKENSRPGKIGCVKLVCESERPTPRKEMR